MLSNNTGPTTADVAVVVHCRATDIHADLAGMDGRERSFTTGERVINIACGLGYVGDPR